MIIVIIIWWNDRQAHEKNYFKKEACCIWYLQKLDKAKACNKSRASLERWNVPESDTSLKVFFLKKNIFLILCSFALKYFYHIFSISILWLVRHNDGYAIKMKTLIVKTRNLKEMVIISWEEVCYEILVCNKSTLS